jgi:hypothetical protein
MLKLLFAFRLNEFESEITNYHLKEKKKKQAAAFLDRYPA